MPDDDYVGVLEQHLPADAPALTPGPLTMVTGEVIGEHEGFARYTIGQRRGLPGGFGEPMYVVAIRPERREVVIGPAAALDGHRVELAEVNWLAAPLSRGQSLRRPDPLSLEGDPRHGDRPERRRRVAVARRAGAGHLAGTVGRPVRRRATRCWAAGSSSEAGRAPDRGAGRWRRRWRARRVPPPRPARSRSASSPSSPLPASRTRSPHPTASWWRSR